MSAKKELVTSQPSKTKPTLSAGLIKGTTVNLSRLIDCYVKGAAFMNGRFWILTLLLLLASCARPQQPRAEGDPSPKPSSIEPSSKFPDVQCRGGVPEALLLTFGAFRLAQPSDFIPTIQQFERQPAPAGKPKITYTCSIFSEDFNQDLQLDYAVLLVNPQTKTTQFRLAINQGKNTFANVVVREYPKPPQSISQPLYVAMFLKRSGEPGAANRDYFPLKRGTPEREAFIATPAIELWLPPAVFQSGTSPTQSAEVQFNRGVGYGSENFYFVDRQLKTVRVAD